MSKWYLRVGGLVSLSLGVAWTPAAAVLAYPTWFYLVCGAAIGFGAVLLASLFGGDV